MSTLLVASEASLLPARNQMAISLGWHIIIACFGMAMPAMIFVLHRKGINGDEVALELAKRWSKVSGVLFAIGAVSGTVLSFELGLLWPELMAQYGDVIGLAFSLEGISFFLEAIFLGIYIYGWGKLPGYIHSLMLIPVILAGIFGSFFVVAVNAWMNAPTGFEIIDGEVVNIDPIAAMFNSAVWFQFLHMFLGAYMVTGFLTAGVYARGMLRGRTDRLHKLGIGVPLVFAGLATLIQPGIGHLAGNRIADEQPIKLAAMEGLATTESDGRVALGGVYIDGELRGAIEIPIDGSLGLLAQNDPNAEVIGLDAVPVEDQPPVNVVRFAFQTMVGIGSALVGLVLWAGWRWKRTSGGMFGSRRLLWALVAAGPLAVIALEAGWVTTEVGRQPWIVHGLMRTEEAVTDASYLWFSLSVLIVVYTFMTLGAWYVLRSMSKRWNAGDYHLDAVYAGDIAAGEHDEEPSELDQLDVVEP